MLFAPDTLDFWVANADSKNVASHTRYTHYNLAELLKPPPAPAGKIVPGALQELRHSRGARTGAVAAWSAV